MKYMILTYGSQQDYDGMAGVASDLTGLDGRGLRGHGQLHGSAQRRTGRLRRARRDPGLQAPAHTRRVQLQDGVPVVTDGPYAETLEVLAGYWIVECDSFDRATEIALRLADCPGPEHVRATAYADVRPIAEYSADLAL